MPAGPSPSKRSRQLAQLLLETLQDSKLLSEEQLKSIVTENYSDVNASDVGDVLEKGISFGAFKRIRGKYQLGGVSMMPCGTMSKGRRARRGRSPSRNRTRARRTTKRRVSRTGKKRGRTPARRRRRIPARKRSQGDAVDALNDSGDGAQNPE